VAQSHVEEFARFVEAWESSQKQSTRSKYAKEDVKVQEAESSNKTSGSPQSFHSYSTIEEDIPDLTLHTNRTQIVDNYVSDFGKGTSAKENQDTVCSASIKSAAHRQAILAPKDRNRALRQNYDLCKKTAPPSTKRQAPKPVKKLWTAKLKGENEPWVAIAPSKAPPQENRTSSPSELGGGTNHQPKPSSESSFEDFEYNALDDPFIVYGTAMGSEFNLGPSFDQEMPQDLDDPFVSLTTSEPFLTASEPIFNQGSMEYAPTGWEATRNPAQVQDTASDAYNHSLLNDMCFQTPPSTAPSLVTTPWSIVSQNMTPLPIQGLCYTPTKRSSEQVMQKDMLEGQNKVLNIDWSFEDFE